MTFYGVIDNWKKILLKLEKYFTDVYLAKKVFLQKVINIHITFVLSFAYDENDIREVNHIHHSPSINQPNHFANEQIPNFNTKYQYNHIKFF